MTLNSHKLIRDKALNKLVSEIIIETYKEGKFPHGWIISGPKGIGKADLAQRIAHYMLSNPQANLASDEFLDDITDNTLYGQLVAGSHPDFLLLERGINSKTGKIKQDISVSEARNVSKFFSRRASGEGWRICIINSADELNRSAANALLKIVEEPPEKSAIIFISSALGRLLPTLRSRCRIIKCAALSDVDVSQSFDDSDLPHPDLELIAALSEGSLLKAKNLSEGGLEMYRELLACLETFPETEWTALNKFIASLSGAANKEKFTLLSEIFMSLMSRLTINTAKNCWPSALIREQNLAQKWQIASKAPELSDMNAELERLFQEKEEFNLDSSLTLSKIFQTLASRVK